MTTVFEYIKVVLDALYPRLPGDDEHKVTQVRSALDVLSRVYLNMLSRPVVADYRNPATRFAYIYRYTTAHANLVATVLNSVPDPQEIMRRDRVTVSCIGGGPGSDFLGCLKYAQLLQVKPRLKCFLLDAEPAWSDAWSDVTDYFPGQVDTVFQAFNVTDLSAATAMTAYRQANLFTLVYFLSEVHARRQAAEWYLRDLLGQLPEGALVLFIDNNVPIWFGWFDEMATATGLRILSSAEGKMRLPWDEEKTALGRYYELFGMPKLKPDVAYRLALKGSLKTRGVGTSRRSPPNSAASRHQR